MNFYPVVMDRLEFVEFRSIIVFNCFDDNLKVRDFYEIIFDAKSDNLFYYYFSLTLDGLWNKIALKIVPKYILIIPTQVKELLLLRVGEEL